MVIALVVSVAVNVGLGILLVGMFKVAVSESKRADVATAWVDKDKRHNIPRPCWERK